MALLDDDLRPAIDFGGLNKLQIVSEILQSTNTAQQQYVAKAWRIRRKSGATVNVRDIFAKVARWANHFKEIGDVAVQYDPVHAALPWAGVRFLLQVRVVLLGRRCADTLQIAVSDFESYSFVLESISSITELICRYALVEELLLRFLAAENAASPPGAAQELRRALVHLYTCVMTYLARARAYFLQPTPS